MTPSISGTSGGTGSASRTADLFSSKASAPARSSQTSVPAAQDNATDRVSLSDEAKKLGAAQTVGAAPGATAAANEAPVDNVVTSYSSQQAQKLVDIYRESSKSSKPVNDAQSSTLSERA